MTDTREASTTDMESVESSASGRARGSPTTWSRATPKSAFAVPMRPKKRRWRTSRACAGCSAGSTTPVSRASASPRSTAAWGSRRHTSARSTWSAWATRTRRVLQVPTFVPCAAVLLEFGSEEQKKRHLPAIIRGDEIWMQFLSEPSGGSDVAGALTTAVRDGDEWIVNGSKIWTTRRLVLRLRPLSPAHELGRAEAPRPQRVHHQDPPAGHRASPHRDDQRHARVLPGVHDRPARPRQRPRRRGRRGLDRRHALDVPRAQRDGWRLAVRERAAGGAREAGQGKDYLFKIARDTGQLGDPRIRDLVGEGLTLTRAGTELSRRLAEGMASGAFPDTTAAVGRLMSAVVAVRRNTIGLELAGANAAASGRGRRRPPGSGCSYMVRQIACIGGGTTEMARNNISERVLGMPREIPTTATCPTATSRRARPRSRDDPAPFRWGSTPGCRSIDGGSARGSHGRRCFDDPDGRARQPPLRRLRCRRGVHRAARGQLAPCAAGMAVLGPGQAQHRARPRGR